MRFVFGPIPENTLLDPVKEGWTPLRQLGINAYTALSVLLAAPICGVAYVYLLRITPILRSNPIMLFLLVLCLVALLPVHEMVHVVVFRRWWKDPRVMLGLWPTKGMWVCYDSPQPRNRLLVMSLAPLFGLSLIPLSVLSFLPPAPWTQFLTFVSIVHVAACTGDVQSFCRVLRQIPKNAVIHNKGWQSFWRVPEVPSPRT